MPQGYVRPPITKQYHIGTPFLKDDSCMVQMHKPRSKGQLQAGSSLQPALYKAYASGAYKEQSPVNALPDARSQNF